MAEFDRAVIVGVGLLGGSLGMALRSRGLATTICGLGRKTAALEQAVQLGAIDEAYTDVATACAGADLVIVCTPVQNVATQLRACLPHVASKALLTDVGSTKLKICQRTAEYDRAIAEVPASDRKLGDFFVGSHPLAGSDKSGVEFAIADLFVDRTCVITPTENAPEALVARTERFWQLLGSRTVRMTPAEHDQAIALTSHLPHVVAAALSASTPDAVLPLAASGWCDTTRVAAGGVELWSQILQENREPVLAALENYSRELQGWIQAIRDGQPQALETLLAVGKTKRDSLAN